MEIPDRLRWLAGSVDGRRWLAGLPDRVVEVVAAWDLEVGQPFADGYASLACPVRRADGSDAVLKVQYPQPECREEATALRGWDGDGAVHLVDHDPRRHALLLERCRPGTPLAAEPAEVALDVFVDLLPRHWTPVADGAPYDLLADVARGWARDLPARWDAAGRPGERWLVDAAIDRIGALLASAPPEVVVVNQDLHGHNVLAAEREPWLVIDPKPVAGERAFGLASVVRAYELGHTAAAVHRRLDRLSDELGVDRERAAGWAAAQAVAWGAGADVEVRERNLQTAAWLLGDRRHR